MAITPLNRNQKIIDENDQLTDRFREWQLAVSRLAIITGTGSPEGVVSAIQTQQYMDLSGTTGSISYIKRDADIGGDTSLGWILV